MRALEANCTSFTLWNYTADNTNERGDLWNDEDLSLFSRDQQRGTSTPDDGGRALDAAVRPYAMAVPGEPLSMSFDIRSKTFRVPLPTAIRRFTAPAEFYVPASQYPGGAVIEAPGGEAHLEGQLLTYLPKADIQVHTVRVRPV